MRSLPDYFYDEEEEGHVRIDSNRVQADVSTSASGLLDINEFECNAASSSSGSKDISA